MIEGRGLTRTFAGRRGLFGRTPVPALRGIDFVLPAGGAVSFIGESGCGKTTLGRILCGFEEPDGGELLVDGEPVVGRSKRERARIFRRIQMIHQDPYSALNPTRTVAKTLEDPLRLRAGQLGVGGDWVESRSRALLEQVGLDPDHCLPRYPHTLSGGMRQRVVIARALSVDPEVLVADEAIAMIDVSLRLGILALLRRLRSEVGVSVVFITHDVATARYVGDDGHLYVLYRGQVVEHGGIDTVITAPMHPYTQCLLSAIPVLRGLELPGPDRIFPLRGLDASTEPPGCLFADRCPTAEADCDDARPALRDSEDLDGGRVDDHATRPQPHVGRWPLDRPDPGQPAERDGPGQSTSDRTGQPTTSGGTGHPGTSGRTEYPGEGGAHRHACLHPAPRAVVAVPKGE